MASTKSTPNQFIRDYSGDPEYLQKYKGGLDMAMDVGANIQLQRELLHIKYCISL